MDILTGMMIWAAEALTLAAVLFSRWLNGRSDRHFLSWSAGFVLHGVGVAFIGIRGQIPDFLSIEIANTMMLAGVGFWIAGMLQFDRRPVEGYVAVPALIWIAGMLLTDVRETFAYRVALYNMAAAVGYAVIVAIILRERAQSPKSRSMMAGFVGLYGLTNLTIAIVALWRQAETFETAPNGTVLFLPAAFCFMGSVMSCAKLLSERSEKHLKMLALTDPLTGVLNRRGLLETFDALRHADRQNRPMLALLHFDLDAFKQINDRYGHQAGDTVLMTYARIGQLPLRGRGFFGRMGGEEFAAVVRVADIAEAVGIAEAVRLTLKRQTIRSGDHRINVTVSTGIAMTDAGTADLDALLSAADRALYAAKENGRDRTAYADDPEIVIVPATDRISPEMPPSDATTDKQVATLTRLVSIGNR